MHRNIKITKHYKVSVVPHPLNPEETWEVVAFDREEVEIVYLDLPYKKKEVTKDLFGNTVKVVSYSRCS